MTTPSPAASKRILIASFSITEGAKAGLDRLKSAGARLGNAAIVKRMIDGRVEFTETQDWGIGRSAAVGAIAAILLPGIGPIAGALGGALAAHFIDAGFPDPLLKQMGSGIPVGTSLLIALVEDADTKHAEEVLKGGGAEILGSGLEGDLEAALQKAKG